VVAAPAIALIKAYQMVLSPMRPPTCRFYPSCSAYALTAIERFGIVRGSWLAARRLLRCHPWNPGGVDHVPQSVGFHDTPVSTRPTHLT
jgi:putative membrane protein insertion efficiency factor